MISHQTVEKGSGKTLLAQHTSILAAKEHGIPTIVVNKPWFGDNFNSFIQSISQPLIIFFDEFEKVHMYFCYIIPSSIKVYLMNHVTLCEGL